MIHGSEKNCKKYLLSLSMILKSISKSQSFQIDIKKSANKNWEVLLKFYVGVDHVVQALKREFEKKFHEDE